MQRPTHSWFLIVWLLLPCSAISAESQLFESIAYRYSVQYPPVWYLDGTRSTDTLTIDNFPASAAVHAVHLPGSDLSRSSQGARLALRRWMARVCSRSSFT